jgi:nitroreductase
VVRDPETRKALADLGLTAARRYAAQTAAGESPWNPIDPTRLSDDEIARTPVPPFLLEPVMKAPVVLAVCVDLKLVAAFDQYVERVGVVPGASIYPFVWNILLAARAEGLGGTITTLATTEEPKVQELLGIPRHVAVAAVVPLGRPVRRLTRLSRKPVAAFAVHERWGGDPLSAEP